VRHEPVQYGKREGGRLAGSGLGGTHHIVARHHLRDGLFLDRRWNFVAGIDHGPKNVWVETQFFE
jgi:hypothetical protein